MNLDETKLKFEERFYLWSSELVKKEFSGGFPLLGSTKATQAICYLKILKKLDEYKANKMAYALMRRGTKQEILKKWDDEFTQEDQEYVNLYLKMCNEENHEEAMQRSPLEYKENKKFNRKNFRKHIKESLKPILGDDFENWGGSTWRYCKQIDSWKIMTYIDTGGQYHQLYYHHSIQASDEIRLIEFISLCRYYGISSQTDWFGLTDEDAEPVAKSLANIIDYFLKATPKLLDGLTVD